MADHKHEQPQPLIPHTVDYSDPEQQKMVTSDHLMQVAEDKNLGITLGTFNLAWTGGTVIRTYKDKEKKIENSYLIPPIYDDLNKVSRGIEFLVNTTTKNSELAVIALQEALSISIEHKSTSTQEAIKTLENDRARKETTQEQYRDITIEIEKLRYGNLLWEKADLKEHLPSWEAVKETKICYPSRVILYDKTKLKEVKIDFNFNTLTPDIKNQIQAIQLEKIDDSSNPFIVYNVHFGHNEEPKTVKNYISQILALPHNRGKTVYIMGDFNARFPSTEPKLVNNGTCVVPYEFRIGGKRCSDSTDAIFRGNSDNSSAKRLKTKIVDFATGESKDLPTVSLAAAEKDTYFFPVPRPGDHEIKCFGDEIKTAQEFIESIEGKTEGKTEFKSLMQSKAFLEKNIFNLPRIAINSLQLSEQQKKLLMDLGVTFEQANDDPAGRMDITRFVLYPHKERDYKILQALPSLLELSRSKHQSSLKLKRTAKILAAIAAIPAVISIGFFTASILFVPAVCLAVGAGVLGVVASIIYRLGKSHSDYPLAYGLAAIATTTADGSKLDAREKKSSIDISLDNSHDTSKDPLLGAEHRNSSGSYGSMKPAPKIAPKKDDEVSPETEAMLRSRNNLHKDVRNQSEGVAEESLLTEEEEVDLDLPDPAPLKPKSD